MLMCLESQWNSMGVSSTKAPARGGGTSSGRRNSWPSLGEILFWYQSSSWSLANPLPLLPGWTSSWKHGHCLCYRDKGGGGWNQETASEVHPLGPGGRGCWKAKGQNVQLGIGPEGPEVWCAKGNMEAGTRSEW